jgi:molecular chaperone GrpE (heat shock protein)
MGESTTEPQADDRVLNGLTALQDMFRRRLLDDKDKRAVIEQLFDRVERAEKVAAGDHLRPVVARFGLLLERMRDASTAGPELMASFADELCDALEDCFGITEVPCDEFDSRYHDVAQVLGDGPQLTISQVLRPGFQREDRVLRPALVVLQREPAVTSDG